MRLPGQDDASTRVESARDDVVPTPVDFRRKVLPFLVWSAAVMAWCAMIADRLPVETIPWDPQVASGDRADDVPILGPPMPVQAAFSEDAPDPEESYILDDNNQGVAP